MSETNNLTENLTRNLTRNLTNILELPVTNSVKGHFAGFQEGKTKEQLFNVDGSDFSETWFGISGTNRDANQTTQTNKFEYISNAINGHPAVRAAVGDFMFYDGSFFAGTNYTVFVVEQRTSDKTNNLIIQGTNAGSNRNLQLGYETDTLIRHTQQGGPSSYTASVPAFTTPIPRIYAITHNSTAGTGQRMFRDGALVASKIHLTDLIDYPGARIGTNYVGELGELIMYDRLLTDDEILLVHQYLSTKWGIALTI